MSDSAKPDEKVQSAEAYAPFHSIAACACNGHESLGNISRGKGTDWNIPKYKTPPATKPIKEAHADGIA